MLKELNDDKIPQKEPELYDGNLAHLNKFFLNAILRTSGKHTNNDNARQAPQNPSETNSVVTLNGKLPKKENQEKKTIKNKSETRTEPRRVARRRWIEKLSAKMLQSIKSAISMTTPFEPRRVRIRKLDAIKRSIKNKFQPNRVRIRKLNALKRFKYSII